MVIGDIAGVPAADAAQGVCRELAAVPLNVPLSAGDLSLVTYVDTALPRESTSWCPLTRTSHSQPLGRLEERRGEVGPL